MSFIKKIKEFQGIKVGQKVALTKGYGSYPIGMVGQVVEISKHKAHTLKVYDELKRGDYSVKRTKSGGAKIKLHGIPEKLFGKPTSKTMFFKPKTYFSVKLPFEKGGFARIMVEKSEIVKVRQLAKIGSRILK